MLVNFLVLKSKEYLTEGDSCFAIFTKYLNVRLCRHFKFSNEHPFPGFRGRSLNFQLWRGAFIRRRCSFRPGCSFIQLRYASNALDKISACSSFMRIKSLHKQIKFIKSWTRKYDKNINFSLFRILISLAGATSIKKGKDDGVEN